MCFYTNIINSFEGEEILALGYSEELHCLILH